MNTSSRFANLPANGIPFVSDEDEVCAICGGIVPPKYNGRNCPNCKEVLQVVYSWDDDSEIHYRASLRRSLRTGFLFSEIEHLEMAMEGDGSLPMLQMPGMTEMILCTLIASRSGNWINGALVEGIEYLDEVLPEGRYCSQHPNSATSDVTVRYGGFEVRFHGTACGGRIAQWDTLRAV